jgi:hypothetical protein
VQVRPRAGSLGQAKAVQQGIASTTWSKIQVAFNNVNRTITGVQLCDQIKITNLLNLAGITSANRMVVKAVSVEAWMCKHNKDGKDGARNYVGSLLFDNNKTDKAKKTPLRKKTGEINVPLRGEDTGIPSLCTRQRPPCGTSWARCATPSQNRQPRRPL